MEWLPLHVLSLMSGTAADGVDAVLANFSVEAGRLQWSVVARSRVDYSPTLRARLLRAMRSTSGNVALITELHAEIGHVYAALAGNVCDKFVVDLVSLSGQTIFHIPRLDPERGFTVKSTLQLGEAAWVLERCRVPVICDFRQSDLAAGGEGAPLVAFGDLQLYHKPGSARAIHNIGGISNFTYLPADGDSSQVLAFDTGPGNCLLDEAAQRFFGLAFDCDGALAACGKVNSALLATWLHHPYLRLPPPKSTGREIFCLEQMLQCAAQVECTNYDLMATLTAFTAASIAAGYRDYVLPRGLDEVLVAGGGAYNPTLMQALRQCLPVPVYTFEDIGLVARDREALAFGVMAYYAYHGVDNTLPQVTGAAHPVVAGKMLLPSAGRRGAVARLRESHR